MARASGNRELNYTAKLDISEILKNADTAIKKFKEISDVTKSLFSSEMKTSTNGFTNSQIVLQDALRNSRLELAALKIKEQELVNQQAASGAATAELTKKINENKLAQQELTKAARAVRDQNKSTTGSYKEAQDRLKALGLEIKNTTGGFNSQSPALQSKIAEYKILNERLKAFDVTMGNHQRNVGNYPKIIGAATAELKTMALNYLSATAILAGVGRIISTNAEISDSMADVQRTTGLTSAEIENLTEKLKGIDTRTTLKGLLEIAAIGGQLNIAKDQLAGFTKAVDQLAVSLGSELQGGAEGIAKSLGVLDNVFKITASNGGDVEKSFNQIGSAILGLGQSGLATGDYLADFGERVGGVAKQAGLSLPVVLAYGAVLQENGVSAEVAGTSFKKLISAMATNAKGFFAIAQLADANLTLRSFTDLINNDTKTALDKFFNGLQKGGGTTTEFMGILKNLKLAQSGMSQSVAALSAGQESLNSHIQDASKDFDNASLSAEQYAIKNNNLAGSLEKLQHEFDNASTDPNSGIGKALKYLIDTTREAIEALQDADSKLRKFLNWTPTGIIWKVLNRAKDTITPVGFVPSMFGSSVEIEEIGKKAIHVQKAVAEKQAAMTRTRATDIINSSKNEVDAIRRIKNEMALLAQTKKNLAFNDGVIKENQNDSTPDKAFGLPKNLSIDPELLKASKNFKAEIKSQLELVAELKKQYQQAYSKSFIEKAGGNGLPIVPGETAAEEKKRQAAAKRIADAAKRAREKELREQETFYSSMSEIETSAYGGTLSAREKEEYDLNRKFVERLNREKNTAADIERIKAAHSAAVAILQEKFATEDKEKRDKQINESLKAAQTYEERKAEINKEYSDKARIIREQANEKGINPDAQIAALNQKWQVELEGEKQTAYQKTEIHRATAANTLELTRNEVKQQIAALKPLLDGKSIPKEIKAKIESEISSLELALQIGLDQNNLNRINDQIDLLQKKLSSKDADGNTLITDQEYERLRSQLEDLISKKNALEGTNGKAKSSFAKGLEENFKYLKGTSTEVLEGLSKDLGQVSVSFNELSSSLGGVNTEAGYAIDTIGRLVGVASDAAGAAASFASGDIIGGVTKTIAAVSGLFSIGKKVKEMNAAARKEVADFYTQAIEGEKQYQDLLKERQLQIIRNNKSALKGIQDEINLRRAQANDFKKESDEILKKLNDMSYVSGENYQHGTWFRKAKVTKTYESLQGKDFDDLALLLAQGKLEGDAKALVERLIEIEKKGYDAASALEALYKESQSQLTGTTADAIASGIINGFKQGKKTYVDFADDFKGMMEDASLSFFRNNFLDAAIDEFYKNFAKLAEDGLSDLDYEVLRDAYAKIIAEGEGLINDFDKVIGGFGKLDDTQIKAFADQVKNLRDELVGMTLDSEDFSKSISESFNKMVKDQVLALEDPEIDKRLADFKKRMEEVFKAGATPADIASLKAEYAEIAKLIDDRIKNFENITGEELKLKVKVDDAELVKLTEEIKKIKNDMINLVTSTTDLPKDVDNSFAALIKQQFVDEFENSEISDQAKKFNEKLKALYSNGGPTKSEMLALKDEYAEIARITAEKIAEFEAKTGQKITQVIDVKIDDTAVNNLRNKIFDLFKTANSDFKAGFNQMVNELLLEKFYNDVIAQALTELNEKMEAARKGGPLTADQIDAMRKDYDAFITDAFKKLSQLEEIAGVKIGSYATEAASVASESVASEYESVKSTILSIFDSADLSSENVFKNFNSMMKKALLSAFDKRFLQTKLQGFIAEYDAISNGLIPSVEEKDRMQAQFKKLIDEGQVELKKLMDFSGISLDEETAASTSVGKIQQELTEKTGSEFLGISRASFEQLKLTYNVNRQATLTLADMFQIARQNLEYNRQTANNTSVLPEMARDIKKLTGGNGNVLPNPTNADLGIY